MLNPSKLQDVHLTSTATTVLEKRYLRRDKEGKIVETPKELFIRVAQAVAKVEERYGHDKTYIDNIAREFYDLMAELRFLPNTPTLINAGTENPMLSACFVLGIEDSMKGIFETLMNDAVIFKSGGGVGHSFSRLRPKGDPVSSSKGISSGPVSFMEVYNVATEKIKQGGVRRGAMLGTLRVDHPDILEFVMCKDDPTKLTNFNISVAVTDSFMEAYFKDEEYELINPRTNKCTGRLRARFVMSKIVEQAWKNGDPGLLFIDEINEHNPTPSICKIESTNPCVTGDTLVAVADGRVSVPIKLLADAGRDVPVYCSDEKGKLHIRVMRNPRKTGEHKKVVRVLLDDGSSVRVTEKHEFILTNGSRVEARSLKQGDSLNLMSKRASTYASVIPSFSGDPHDVKYFWINCSAQQDWFIEHRLIADFYFREFHGECLKYAWGQVIHHVDFNGLNNAPSNLRVMTKSAHRQLHTNLGDNIFKNKQWQDMMRLKNHVGKQRGADTRARLSRHSRRKFETDEVRNKIAATLKDKWLDPTYRKNMLERRAETRRLTGNHKVVSVISDGYADVFNGTVDEFHNYYIGGFESAIDGDKLYSFVNVKNCGEQPLEDGASCNLGSINVSKFVKLGDDYYKEMKSAKSLLQHAHNQIDFDQLCKTVEKAVHFLDNVIDANKFPLKKIEETTKGNRKIGLGIMGWADMLCQLGIPYGSAESVQLARSLMSYIRDAAVRASAALAFEKGSFPNFSKSIFAGCSLPRRNATLTTIAPTGTIGMIAGASGGIEPLFGVAYKKQNVLDGQSFLDVNKFFELRLKELGLYSDVLVDKVIERGSVQGLAELPEDVQAAFKTAHDLTPDQHVDMQAAFQEFTDNAVSKTVNLSHTATKEDVEKVYLSAYQKKCKGITIYRDGSRDGQILTVGSKTVPAPELSTTPSIRKRPKTIAGATTLLQTGCGKIYVTVNDDGKGLFEIFTALGKCGGCAASQTEAISRLVSLALRANVDPREVVHQLKGIRCPTPAMGVGGVVLSCADAVGQALEEFLNASGSRQAGTPQSKAETSGMCPQCPDCGALLTFKEGCVSCPNSGCGYSRCS